MLIVTNPAGFKFVWSDGSNVVEVFHNKATFPDCPLEVVSLNGEPRSEATLNRLAYSTSEYSHL